LVFASPNEKSAEQQHACADTEVDPIREQLTAEQIIKEICCEHNGVEAKDTAQRRIFGKRAERQQHENKQGDIGKRKQYGDDLYHMFAERKWNCVGKGTVAHEADDCVQSADDHEHDTPTGFDGTVS
jgi:hypothetical protein